MYICNCRVAKVNDDDDDVQCNTECVGGCLVANYYLLLLGSTTNPSLSHTHWQNAEMSCKYDRTLTMYSPSISLSLPLVLPTTNITNLT